MQKLLLLLVAPDRTTIGASARYAWWMVFGTMTSGCKLNILRRYFDSMQRQQGGHGGTLQFGCRG